MILQRHWSLRMLVTSPLVLMLLLSIYEFEVASATTDPDLDYKRLYDLGFDKRAYTYSANKRPQYDFGIGKRSPDSSRQKMYSFGLGKRFSNNDNSIYEDYFDDDLAHNDYNKRIKPYEFGLGKRAAPAPYSFGLGKRAAPAPYSFGLGKRGPSSQGKMYSFGLGKRGLSSEFSGISQRSQRYNFGIGKRDVNDDLSDFLASLDDDKSHNIYTRASQRYNFGVGKRGLASEFSNLSPRSQRYNFGIGKRDVGEELNDILEPMDNEKTHNIYTRASQKYNFGLGKRFSSYDNDDIDDELNSIYDQANSDLGKRSRYEFGLGKRNSEEFSDVMQLVDGMNRDARAKQRYSFGLGKREVSKEDLQQLEEDVSPTSAASPTGSRNRFDDNVNNNLSQQHGSNTRKREVAIENDNNKQHQMTSKL